SSSRKTHRSGSPSHRRHSKTNATTSSLSTKSPNGSAALLKNPASISSRNSAARNSSSKTTASPASSPKTKASLKTATRKTITHPATNSAPKSPSSQKARAARSPSSSSRNTSSTTSILKSIAAASRNFGTSSQAEFSPATSRIRSAGLSPPTCTAAAGSTVS